MRNEFTRVASLVECGEDLQYIDGYLHMTGMWTRRDGDTKCNEKEGKTRSTEW